MGLLRVPGNGEGKSNERRSRAKQYLDQVFSAGGSDAHADKSISKLIDYAKNTSNRLPEIARSVVRKGQKAMRRGNRRRAALSSKVLTQLITKIPDHSYLISDYVVTFIFLVLRGDVCRMRWIENLIIAFLCTDSSLSVVDDLVPELIQCAIIRPQRPSYNSLRRAILTRGLALRCLSRAIPVLASNLTLQEHSPDIARAVQPGLGLGLTEFVDPLRSCTQLDFPDPLALDTALAAGAVIKQVGICGSVAAISSFGQELVRFSTRQTSCVPLMEITSVVSAADVNFYCAHNATALLAMRILSYSITGRMRFHLATALTSQLTDNIRPDLLVHFISAAVLPQCGPLSGSIDTFMAKVDEVLHIVDEIGLQPREDRVLERRLEAVASDNDEIPLPAALLATKELVRAAQLPQCRSSVATTLLDIVVGMSGRTVSLVHVLRLVAMNCDSNSLSEYETLPWITVFDTKQDSDTWMFSVWVIALLMALLRTAATQVGSNEDPRAQAPAPPSDMSAPLQPLLELCDKGLAAIKAELEGVDECYYLIAAQSIISSCIFFLLCANARGLASIPATFSVWGRPPIHPEYDSFPMEHIKASVEASLAQLSIGQIGQQIEQKVIMRQRRPTIISPPEKERWQAPVSSLPLDTPLLTRYNLIATQAKSKGALTRRGMTAFLARNSQQDDSSSVSDSSSLDLEPINIPVTSNLQHELAPIEASDLRPCSVSARESITDDAPFFFPDQPSWSVGAVFSSNALCSIYRRALSLVRLTFSSTPADRAFLSPEFYAVHASVLLAAPAGYRGLAGIVPLLLEVSQFNTEWHEYALNALNWLATLSPQQNDSQEANQGSVDEDVSFLSPSSDSSGDFGQILIDHATFPLTRESLLTAVTHASSSLVNQTQEFVHQFIKRVIPAAMAVGILSPVQPVSLQTTSLMSPAKVDTTNTTLSVTAAAPLESEEEDYAIQDGLLRGLRLTYQDALSSLKPDALLAASMNVPELLLI